MIALFMPRSHWPLVFTLLSVLTLLLMLPAHAQTAIGERHYISDILLVPLRTGPTIQHRIINAGLRSGTEVILLENDTEAQWSRIRVGEQEGWIPTRHLLDQPIARAQLEEVEARLATLQQEFADLQARSADTEHGISTVSADVAALTAERDEALREIDRLNQLAGTELTLDRQNQDLLARNRTLQAEVEQLSAMNNSLVRESDQWRMIIGGGLVLSGILVGLIFPSISRRRRSDGWN